MSEQIEPQPASHASKSGAVETSVLVSVIIPTFNRAYVVSRAIESALAQTYRNVEIIVVDDGSTDDTARVLASYGNRIRVVKQPNAGPSAARNAGIRESKGELVAFLDSDDIWLPTKVQRQVALLQSVSESVPCCLCNGITRNTAGREWHVFDNALVFPSQDEGLWLNPAEVLATRFVLFCQVVAIRRSALERVGYFDEDMAFMEDYDLSLRLSIEGPWTFIREPLAIMNHNPEDSLSMRVAGEHVAHAEYVLKTRERVLADLLAKIPPQIEITRRVERAVRWSRRSLQLAHLCTSRYWPTRLVGSILTRAESFRMALFRRTKDFPRAKTVSVAQGFTQSAPSADAS